MVKYFAILLFSLPAYCEEFRERVVIIDTGLSTMNSIGVCKDGHKDFTNTGFTDNVGHGDIVYRIASQLVDYSKYCFTIIKWTDSRERMTADNSYFSNIMKYVYSLKPKFVNWSADGSSYNAEELFFMKKLVLTGTEFFVSAGNDSRNLSIKCNVYPACYDLRNFNVVSSNDESGNKLLTSNFGGPARITKLGIYNFNNRIYTGTSFASPAALNEELRR